MNKHELFWLGLGALLTAIEIVAFIIFCAVQKDVVSFNKAWCLVLVPNFFFTFFQFLVNYFSLTEGRV